MLVDPLVILGVSLKKFDNFGHFRRWAKVEVYQQKVAIDCDRGECLYKYKYIFFSEGSENEKMISGVGEVIHTSPDYDSQVHYDLNLDEV